MGYAAVFGDRRLNLVEFELYSYIQRRCIQASSEEGRAEIAQEVAERKAVEIERRARAIEQAARARVLALPAPVAPAVASAVDAHATLEETGQSEDTGEDDEATRRRIEIAVRMQMYAHIPLDPEAYDEDTREQVLAANRSGY